jgi:hypothetical protein
MYRYRCKRGTGIGDTAHTPVHTKQQEALMPAQLQVQVHQCTRLYVYRNKYNGFDDCTYTCIGTAARTHVYIQVQIQELYNTRLYICRYRSNGTRAYKYKYRAQSTYACTCIYTRKGTAAYIYICRYSSTHACTYTVTGTTAHMPVHIEVQVQQDTRLYIYRYRYRYSINHACTYTGKYSSTHSCTYTDRGATVPTPVHIQHSRLYV